MTTLPTIMGMLVSGGAIRGTKEKIGGSFQRKGGFIALRTARFTHARGSFGPFHAPHNPVFGRSTHRTTPYSVITALLEGL